MKNNSISFARNRKALMALLLGTGFLASQPMYAMTAENVAVVQQQESVKGVVKDAQGEPVIGASVVVKGTTNGTITDFDGKFQLNAARGAVLQISFVGFKTQEVKVAGKQLNVTLREDKEVLDEVVVVGFGSQKKANLTGAVATVKMDEVMGDRPLTSATNALQGSVAGLLVSSNGNGPGVAQSFKIRGDMSINGGGPLVLIDNVEGDIDNVNPDDIETITVLKDAASSAIYGARAAGGVILITTKRPKGKGKFKLNYNNNFAFANAMNLPEQVSLDRYLQAYSDAAGDTFWTPKNESVTRWRELLAQYNQDPSSMKLIGDATYVDDDGGLYYLREKDLMKDMMEGSFQMSHNLSASGGTDRLRYRLSAGMVKQDGVLITNKDEFERKNFSGFVSADIFKWFTQEANFSYANNERSFPESFNVFTTRLPSFYPEGICPEGGDYGLGGAGLPYFTPKDQIEWANKKSWKVANPRIFLKSILKPIKNLEMVFEYTYDRKNIDYDYNSGVHEYTSIQGGAGVTPALDYFEMSKASTDYNAFNIYATYKWKLKKHNFKVMAGFNQESKYYQKMATTSYGQAIPDVPSLGSGTVSLKSTDSYDDVALRGGFFRVNYNYADRYMLEVNGRYDGSSKFPKNNRFGFFPSVSVGWQLAQEKFMKGAQDWLGNLKLRASFGEIGNQNIRSYTYAPTLTMNNMYSGWLMNGTYVTACNSIPDLVRSNFTWEKVRTLNVGLDFSMFKNRLNGVFEWFQRDTRGMLAPGMQLPGVVGARAPFQNTADMRSRGWELALNWRDKVGKFGYRVGFNISDAQAEITKFDSNESKLLSSHYTGKKLGEIWGYVADGFYTVDDFVDTSSWILKEGVTDIEGSSPRPGDVKFKNLMDDEGHQNIITRGLETVDNPGDRKIIGNNTPRYMYGITLGGSYGGFDLNIFMQGVGKRDAWIANTLTFPLYDDYKFIPLYKGLEDYWRPVDEAGGNFECANPGAKYPRVYGGYGNSGSNYRCSDKYLLNASYLRIKNVTFSYSFPKYWISRIALQNLKAFVSIENLATFTSLPKGIDPETLQYNYPAFRTVSFGLNLTL